MLNQHLKKFCLTTMFSSQDISSNVYLTFFLVGTVVHAAEVKQPGARS